MKNKISPGSNMRWEGSRMMMPQHVEALRKRKLEQKKVEKPILDEQEWEIIEQNICDAMAETLPLEIRYFRDGFKIKLIGFALILISRIRYLDLRIKTVIVVICYSAIFLARKSAMRR